MINGRSLYSIYRNAGTGFLAYRLERLFSKIETPADIAIHNEVLEEMVKIIAGKEKAFYKGIFEALFNVRVDRKKRFLFRMAEQILTIGQKKKG